MTAAGPWERHARQWARVGPPLRPSAEDVAIAGRAVDRWREATGRDDPAVLLLGVTPELWSIDTGPRSRWSAVDRSSDMVRAVWSGPIRPGDAALVADWRRLPCRASMFDLAFADGCLTNLPFPGGYVSICDEIGRICASDALWVARCFVQSSRAEAAADVVAELEAEPAGGFHAFKWRVAMALQPDAETGVALADVYDAFAAAAPDLEALAARRGWPAETVRTIEAYRGLRVRYTFPTLEELGALLRDSGFEILEIAVPTYELGDRCPTLVLAPRSAR